MESKEDVIIRENEKMLRRLLSGLKNLPGIQCNYDLQISNPDVILKIENGWTFRAHVTNDKNWKEIACGMVILQVFRRGILCDHTKK